MAANWMRRTALVAACASALLLAACGSSTTESAITPDRFIAFGDAYSDIGQKGSRYTVNNDTVNNWTLQLASHYQKTLAPVSAGERMWTPKMEARVVQDLDLKGHEHVLEVGTGSGYLTALLAARAARVTSIEIDPALAKFGADNLARAGVTNAVVLTGDAARGWRGEAPYDVIVFTGSMEVLPEEVFSQLKAEGRVFAVVGKRPVMAAQLVNVSASGGRQSRTLFETVVAPLANAARSPAFVF